MHITKGSYWYAYYQKVRIGMNITKATYIHTFEKRDNYVEQNSNNNHRLDLSFSMLTSYKPPIGYDITQTSNRIWHHTNIQQDVTSQQPPCSAPRGVSAVGEYTSLPLLFVSHSLYLSLSLSLSLSLTHTLFLYIYPSLSHTHTHSLSLSLSFSVKFSSKLLY